MSSETICPYDGDYCQAKQEKLESWQSSIEYLANNRINRQFTTVGDMFDGCPLYPHTQCQRFLRYQRMLDRIKNIKNERQQ